MYCLLYHLPQVYTVCVIDDQKLHEGGNCVCFCWRHMHIAWHNDWHLMDVQEIVAEWMEVVLYVICTEMASSPFRKTYENTDIVDFDKGWRSLLFHNLISYLGVCWTGTVFSRN